MLIVKVDFGDHVAGYGWILIVILDVEVDDNEEIPIVKANARGRIVEHEEVFVDEVDASGVHLKCHDDDGGGCDCKSREGHDGFEGVVEFEGLSPSLR